MSKVNILIVEDEMLIAENLRGKLVRLGYEIAGIAGTSDEAIEMALQLRPQIILMDIQLNSQMDGIETAETIRKQHDVAVIYLTAHSDPTTLARAKITEPFGYILKPFESGDLVTQIELALYRHQANRQIREQSELLRVTLSSIGDAVIATDADGIITFINSVAASLTEWREEEAIGKPVQEVFRVITADTRPVLGDPVSNVTRSGETFGLVNPASLMRRGGGEVPIDHSGAPIVDGKGNIRGEVLVFRDVTERRQAEKRISDSELRFRSMIENAPDPIFIQTDYNFAYLNPAAYRLFKIKAADELIGKPVLERIHPDSRDIVRERIYQLNRNRRRVSDLLEHRFLCLDGTAVWVETSGEPIVYDGKDGALVFVRDISRRKAVQTELQRNEERFRSLAESAPVGIVISNRAGKTLYINRSFTELFGYTISDISSVEDWWPLAYPDEKMRAKVRSIWLTALERAAETNAPIEPFEYPVACKDGTVRHVEFQLTSTGDLNFVILSDVTGRKQAEQAIRKSSENLRITLNSIGDAVIATDLEGSVTRMNPVAEALTGWTFVQAKNQPIEEVFHIVNAQTGEKAANPVEEVLETGKIVGLANHTKLISKNGNEYQISDSGSPIKDNAGQTAGVVLVFRDETERYQMREAVIRERRILQLFVEHAPAAIAMFDREMKYISASRRFLTDYDLGTQNIIGKSHYEIFPEIPERWKKIHRRCLAGAIERCDEDPFPRASGNLDWIRWEIHPWYESTGDIGGILLFSEVITERKQNEQRIAHINQVLKAIRGVNQLITYEKDRDVLLRRTCEILVEMRGYRAAWIAICDKEGKLQAAAESGIGELFATIETELKLGKIPICCANVWADRKDVAAMCNIGENCGACPLAILDRDTSAMAGVLCHEDREYGVLVVALPENIGDLEDEQSLFKELTDDVGFALYGIDQEEKRLRAEARYTVLFESSSDGILIADIETKQLKYANSAICRFFGYSEAEIGTLRVPDLHPSQNVAEILSGFDALARGEITLTPDIPCVRKDGTLVYADVNAVPIVIDGRTCLAGFFRDITARKQAETERENLQAQLIQAQKMESVGRLAGGVAHDYNNTLSVILGYTELALERDDLSEKLREDLKEIYSAAVRSRDITRQLLAFARKQTIAPEVLDLNVTIENMLRILRRLIGEDIDLVWLPGKGLQPVLMDPSQIDQILANLCVNARDAISDIGKVTIETGAVSIDQEYCRNHAGFTPGDFVLLSVSDDGCGMDRDTQGKIFEPFYTTKGVGKGTGLGLATVYGIVKQNNGLINVYSEPGMGTTFRIYLRRHSADIPDAVLEVKGRTAVGRGELLLIVEDDVSILKLAERLLSELNYEVLIAKTPGEALHLAEVHNAEIDLLITDVVMPEMNGRELAEKLQATFCPDLKCLYMSGYTANIIAHRGVLDKGFRFIQKPFSTNDLAKKVRDALDGKSQGEA